jgi:hypothetical protein
MKKIAAAVIMLALAAGFVWSQELMSVTRFGGSFSVDFAARPSLGEVKDSFFEGTTVIPGIEFETLHRNFGFVARTGVMFRPYETDIPGLERTWDLDLRPEIGARLHIFGWNAFLDPYIEANLGTGLTVDITGYGDQYADSRREMKLSWYTGVGAGMNVVLGNVYLGGTFRYNFFNQPFPGTQFEKYDLGKFAVSLHVGLNVENWVERTLFGYRRAN